MKKERALTCEPMLSATKEEKRGGARFLGRGAAGKRWATPWAVLAKREGEKEQAVGEGSWAGDAS